MKSLNNELVQYLKNTGAITSKLIEKAFLQIDRADFVQEDFHDSAYEDFPLPIGSGQTISQPTTVAIQLDLLGLKSGQKILDVGYGSGYTTSLLAAAVKPGRVFAVEIEKDVAKSGARNIEKYHFISSGQVQVISGDGSKGFPNEAPFDRILVSAEADEIPEYLLNQLEIEGIMVIPYRNALLKIVRQSANKFSTQEHPGFVFVPLVRTK